MKTDIDRINEQKGLIDNALADIINLKVHMLTEDELENIIEAIKRLQNAANSIYWRADQAKRLETLDQILAG